MADTLCENTLDIGSVGCTGVARERGVGLGGCGSLGDAEDVGPLFDFFLEVLGVEGGITVVFGQLLVGDIIE